jgi:hypothetical protein
MVLVGCDRLKKGTNPPQETASGQNVTKLPPVKVNIPTPQPVGPKEVSPPAENITSPEIKESAPSAGDGPAIPPTAAQNLGVTAIEEPAMAPVDAEETSVPPTKAPAKETASASTEAASPKEKAKPAGKREQKTTTPDDVRAKIEELQAIKTPKALEAWVKRHVATDHVLRKLSGRDIRKSDNENDKILRTIFPKVVVSHISPFLQLIHNYKVDSVVLLQGNKSSQSFEATMKWSEGTPPEGTPKTAKIRVSTMSNGRVVDVGTDEMGLYSLIKLTYDGIAGKPDERALWSKFEEPAK